jgi:hypothetical protein
LTSNVALEVRISVRRTPCPERSSTTGPASPPPSLKLAPASNPEEPRLDVLSSPELRLEPLSRLKLESELGVSVRLLSPPGLSVSEFPRLDPVSSEDVGVLKPESMLDVGASGSRLEEGSLSDGGVSGAGVRLRGVGLSRSGVIGGIAEMSGAAAGVGGVGAGAGAGAGLATSGTGAGAGVETGGGTSGAGVGAATGAGLGLARSGAGVSVGIGGGASGVGAGAGVAAVRSGAPNPGEGLLAGAPTDGKLSVDAPLVVGADVVEVDVSGAGAEASDGINDGLADAVSGAGAKASDRIDDGLADAVSDGVVVASEAPPPGCVADVDASGARVGPV